MEVKSLIWRTALSIGTIHIFKKRGSILGHLPDQERISQKLFESKLYHSLKPIDLNQPIYVEGESKRIGTIHIPDSIWIAMMGSRRIYIEVNDIQERINHIRR